jgi:hypothetical protein
MNHNAYSYAQDHNILTCIIPFASRLFANDWGLACCLLRQTIKSLLNSEDPRLSVIVVGNDHPGGFLDEDPRLHFISIPAASQQIGSLRDTAIMVKDQLTKMQLGWEYAKKHLPSRYVMRVDADDFLSRKVVGFLSKCECRPGFRISDGWVWQDGGCYFIEQTEKFDYLCGTSNIFRFDIAEKTFDLRDINFPLPEYIKKVNPDLKFSLITNRFHQYAGVAMALLKMEISRVPFKAAVYRVGHINSEMQRTIKFHSLRQFFGRIRRLRLLTGSLRREFCLNPKPSL